MSIDPTYTVDTSLANVGVDTLMTKAFELTHQIDRAREKRAQASGAAEYAIHHNAIAEAREQRDAIVREMTRRSDGMERALVRVEAAERIMRGVDETLASAVLPGVIGNGEAEAGLAEAREALDMMMESTTTLTCSLVKDQALSDRIAKAAIAIVRPIRDRAREVGKASRR